ncbi:MAG TPA: hypothetical protein VGO30_21510 [Mycobacterium sp.]|nr:hypothetical protein [Mycobacterium sp.]
MTADASPQVSTGILAGIREDLLESGWWSVGWRTPGATAGTGAAAAAIG